MGAPCILPSPQCLEGNFRMPRAASQVQLPPPTPAGVGARDLLGSPRWQKPSQLTEVGNNCKSENGIDRDRSLVLAVKPVCSTDVLALAPPTVYATRHDSIAVE